MGYHDKTASNPQAKGQSAQLYDLALDSQPSALQQAWPGAALARQSRRAGQSLLQLQRRYGNHYVQRVLALAQEADDEVARDSGISSSGEVTPDVEKAIQQERGGGQPLDSGVRKQMEPALGADFSGVRVHTDRQADTLNRSLHARAFATGQDIFFRSEEYRPGTSGGRELLAHELTHVVQQTGGRQIQPKLAVSQPGDRYEQEADQLARAVMRSEQQFAQSSPQNGVASRQPEEDEETVRTQPEKEKEEKDESAQMRHDPAQVARQDEDEQQPAQAKSVQRQAADEKEKVQTQPEEEKDEPAPDVAPLQVARAGEKVAPVAPTPSAGPAKPASAAVGDTAPGVVDLKTVGGSYNNVPEAIATWLESQGRKKRGKVNMRFGKLTATKPVLMEKTADGIELEKSEALPLSHPLFPNSGEGVGSLLPHLNLEEGKEISGHIGLGPQVTKATALAKQLQQNAELIGLKGLKVPEIPHLENKLENGKLQLGPAEVPVRLGKILDGKVSVEADDERVTKLEGNVKAQIQGLASGEVELKRSEQGIVTGKGIVEAQLTKNIAGKVNLFWDGEAVSGDGMVDYKGEKLSGQVNVQVIDKKQAEQLAEQKQPPAPKAEVSPAAAGAKRREPTEYAVFGTGNLTFSFTDWLTGAAQVILDPKGNVTVIGKITPQKEVELLPQKDYSKDLFSAQATAGYGLPVVGRIGIFGKVDLDAFAKLGPAKLFDIVVEGEYSTDPKKMNNFQIMGTLNISAAAGLRLRGEAGALLEVLGHDLKAGAGINGIAGVRGYAEARPVIGYREKAAEGEDKKGEFFIRGDLEIAGQPFLSLSGDLFVEVDAPWWSPVPDKKWTWPLGDKTWPIGGTFGLNASVDYVFGSGQAPAIDFKPVEFSADKFLTDLYSDKAKASGEQAAEKAGEWKEKNAKDAEPPKGEKKGNAEPSKATDKPEAQSTVQAGGGKKAVKPADPDAQTAEGKTVKEYQEEARQKGKKLEGKDVGKGAEAPERVIGRPKPADSVAATEPIETAFSMQGEHHILIVIPGAIPKVEMESKRDLLSNKIGRGIGKLMRLGAKPEQIEKLKKIGKDAKILQEKAREKKTDPTKELNQIPGFNDILSSLKLVKNNLEEYGNDWKTQDIEQDSAEKAALEGARTSGSIDQSAWYATVEEWAAIKAAEDAKGWGKTRLASNDVSFNRNILKQGIDYYAPNDKPKRVIRQERSAARNEAFKFFDAAVAATGAHEIYVNMQKAQKVVNDLLGQGALDLQSHHFDQVAKNPQTYEKDRKARIRNKLSKKAKNLPKKEQDEMAASEEKRKQIMTLWVEQAYEQDVELKKDQPLDEVSIFFVPKDIHFGVIHKAEREEEKKKKEFYEEEHKFDDYTSGPF